MRTGNKLITAASGARFDWLQNTDTIDRPNMSSLIRIISASPTICYMAVHELNELIRERRLEGSSSDSTAGPMKGNTTVMGSVDKSGAPFK